MKLVQLMRANQKGPGQALCRMVAELVLCESKASLQATPVY